MAFKNFLNDMLVQSLSDYGYLKVEGVFQTENDFFFLTYKTDKQALGLNSSRKNRTLSLEELRKTVQLDGIGYIDACNSFITYSKYEKFHKIAKTLKNTSSQENKFKVIFGLKSFLVTDGEIDKKTGRANLFGFDTKENLWTNVEVDFNLKHSIEAVSYGTSILNEDGKLVELSNKIGDVK